MNIPLIGQGSNAPPPVQADVGTNGELLIMQIVYHGLQCNACPMTIDYAEAFHAKFAAALAAAKSVRAAVRGNGHTIRIP